MTGSEQVKTRVLLSDRLVSPLANRRSFVETAMRFRASVAISQKSERVNPDISIKVAMPGNSTSPNTDNKKRTNSGMIPGVENYDGVRFNPKDKGGPDKVFKWGTRYGDRSNPTNVKPNWGWVEKPKQVTRDEILAESFKQNKPRIRIRRFDVNKRTNEVVPSSEVELNPFSLSNEPRSSGSSSKQLPGNTIGRSVPGGNLLQRAARVAGILADPDGRLRCPPGTPAANQFTDSTGSNCFGFSASEIIGAAGRVASFLFGLDDSPLAQRVLTRNRDRNQAPGSVRNTPNMWQALGADVSNPGRVIWESPDGRRHSVPTHWQVEEAPNTHRQFKNGLQRGRNSLRAQDMRIDDLKRSLDVRQRGGWDKNSDLIETAEKLRNSGVMTTLFVGRPRSEQEVNELVSAILFQRDGSLAQLSDAERQALFNAEKARYFETERALLKEFLDSVIQNPEHMRTISEIKWNPQSLVGRGDSEAQAYATFGEGFTPDSTGIEVDIAQILSNMSSMLPEIEEYHRLRIDALGGTDAANAQQLTDFLVATEAFSKETAAMVAGERGFARHIMAHEIAHTKQFRMLYKNIQDMANASGQFQVPGTRKVVSSANDLTNEDMIRCVNAFVKGNLRIPEFERAMQRADVVMFVAGKYPQSFRDGDPVKYLEAMAELDALRSLGVIHGDDIDAALSWQDEVFDTRFLDDRNLTNAQVISAFESEYRDFLSGVKVDPRVQETLIQRERINAARQAQQAQRDFELSILEKVEEDIIDDIANFELEEELLRKQMQDNPNDPIISREWSEAKKRLDTARKAWKTKYSDDYADQGSANEILKERVKANREAGQKFTPDEIQKRNDIAAERARKDAEKAEKEAKKAERARVAAEREAKRAELADKRERERLERDAERARKAEQRAKREEERAKRDAENAERRAKQDAKRKEKEQKENREEKLEKETRAAAEKIDSEEDVIDELATVISMIKGANLSGESLKRMETIKKIYMERFREIQISNDPMISGQAIRRKLDNMLREKLNPGETKRPSKPSRPDTPDAENIDAPQPKPKKAKPRKIPANKSSVKKLADDERSDLFGKSTPKERQAIVDLSDPETSLTAQLLDPSSRADAVSTISKRSRRRANLGLEDGKSVQEATVERHVEEVLLPALDLIEQSNLSRPVTIEAELELDDDQLQALDTAATVDVPGFIHGPVINGDRPSTGGSIGAPDAETGKQKHRVVINVDEGQRGYYPNWSDTSSFRPKDYEQKLVLPPGKIKIVERRVEKDGTVTLIGNVVEQTDTEDILDSIANGPDAESLPKATRSRIQKAVNKHISDRRKSGKTGRGPTTPEDVRQDIADRNEAANVEIEKAGGGVGQFDASYVGKIKEAEGIGDEADEEVFGKAETSVQRAKSRTEKIRSITEKILAAVEEGMVDEDIEIDGKDIDPRVVDILENYTPDEVQEILKQEAAKVHADIDKRPRVVVREDELESIVDGGTYSVDQPEQPPATPANVSPRLRPVGEPSKPEDTRPRLRPVEPTNSQQGTVENTTSQTVELFDSLPIENRPFDLETRQYGRTQNWIIKLEDIDPAVLAEADARLNDESRWSAREVDMFEVSPGKWKRGEDLSIQQRETLPKTTSYEYRQTGSPYWLSREVAMAEAVGSFAYDKDTREFDINKIRKQTNEIDEYGINARRGDAGGMALSSRGGRTSGASRQALASRGKRSLTERLVRAALDRTDMSEDSKETVGFVVDAAKKMRMGPVGQAALVQDIARRGGRDAAIWALRKQLENGKLNQSQFDSLMKVVDRVAPEGLPDPVKREIARGIKKADEIIEERLLTDENRERLDQATDAISDRASQVSEKIRQTRLGRRIAERRSRSQGESEFDRSIDEAQRMAVISSAPQGDKDPFASPPTANPVQGMSPPSSNQFGEYDPFAEFSSSPSLPAQDPAPSGSRRKRRNDRIRQDEEMNSVGMLPDSRDLEYDPFTDTFISKSLRDKPRNDLHESKDFSAVINFAEQIIDKTLHKVAV